MSQMRLVTSLGFAVMLLAGSCLHAQSAVAPAAALPAQILSAKKVFISNASGEFISSEWSGGADRTYNEFYAATKNWGRYEIVQTPADADIVFEISMNIFQSHPPFFKVRVLDPKTGIVLWTVVEDFSIVGMKGSRDKKLDDGIASVVDDLKALVSRPPVTAP